MEWTFALIGLIVGAIAAGAIVFWFANRVRTDLAHRLKELSATVEATRTDLQAAQVRVATLEAENKALADIKSELDGVRAELVQVNSEKGLLEGKIEEQQRAYEAWKVERAELEEKLKEEFQGLASDALRKNNAAFLELADVKLKEGEKDLEVRQKSIENLVKPISESLSKVDEQVKEIEKEREGAYKGLLAQVEMLRTTNERLNKETTTLAQALKGSSTRGRWGEMQLRRMAELHGMLEYCDFFLQSSSEDDEGNRKRPDMVVRMPNERCVIVDSKVPLDDIVEPGENEDQTVHLERVGEFSKRVRGHIQALKQRGYVDIASTPDFVVLYMPSPRLLELALEGDPSLLEYAYQRDVVLATPSTLMGLLRTIAYVWKQDKLAQEAIKIAEEGGKLHRGIADFMKNFTEIGKAIDKAQEKFNVAQGHVRRRIVSSALRLEQMGVRNVKSLRDTHPELIGGALVELPESTEALFDLETDDVLIEAEEL